MLPVVYPSERYVIDAPPGLWDGMDDVARAIYSTRQAAAMLNVGQNTLRDWATRAGVERVRDPAYDKRELGWTVGMLQHIADLHHRKLGKPPAEPEPSRRMRELTARVAEMEARLADLEARAAGILPSRARPAGQQPHADDAPVSHTPRLPRPTVRLSESRDTLPEGWVPVSQWAREHGIPLRTISEAYRPSDERKRVAAPELAPHVGPYKRGRVSNINNVWDAEQQALALARWRDRIPPRTDEPGGAR